MASGELYDLIAENRALRAELRVHLEARKAFARSYWSDLGAKRVRTIDLAHQRIIQMASLLLDAHRIALRDEEGLSIDLITDALTHINRRLEREVLPHF